MLLKSSCRYCGTTLEFNAEQVGQSIACPKCERETKLIAPPKEWTLKLGFGKPISKFATCADCGAQVSRRALMCPNCGAAHARFSVVFALTCRVLLALAILSAVGFFLGWLFGIVVVPHQPP